MELTFETLISLSLPIRLAVVAIVLPAVLLIVIRISTTIRYKLSLSSHLSARSFKSTRPLSPPHIPYSIPFLGSAIPFLTPRPGAFWRQLLKTHPRATGVCTLLIGGLTTHILFSPSAVQALFKSRGTTRQPFNNQVVRNGLGVSKDECDRFYGIDRELPPHGKDGSDGGKQTVHPVIQQERINLETLLRTDRVNELTAEFTAVLRAQLERELMGDGEAAVVDLYAWSRPRMFKASIAALMGTMMLELCPKLEPDFFEFDGIMLSLFFGLPRFLIPDAFKIRTRILDSLENYHEAAVAESNDQPVDPNGTVKWEPIYGSRANRARQLLYREVGLSLRARAGLDLGFIFAISSNAIPTVGWMLMHILDPNGDKSIYTRVMDELKTARCADGTINIPTLVSLPLLQSIFQEVLRLYTDLLVTRELQQNIVLPIDQGPDATQVLLKKHDIVMAPSWIGHHDETRWTDPPSETFYAERFLKDDPLSGIPVFSLTGSLGKLFPFGGGVSMCPGRVFAKQEVLAGVAMALLEFDFDVLGIRDEQGKDTQQIPPPKNGFGGSGVMVPGGDMTVRISRRK